MKVLTLVASERVFGINDPSLIAWVIVLVYFSGMFLCWRAQYSHRVFDDMGKRILWVTLSILLLLLGLNKQLDLHDLVMSTVRDLVSGEIRSSVLQGIFLVCLLAIGGAAFWLGKKLLYHSNRELRAAYIAFLSLLAFQVLRFSPGPAGALLASHPISEQEGLFHVHFIELIELPILIVVGYWARIQASIRSTQSE